MKNCSILFLFLLIFSKTSSGQNTPTINSSYTTQNSPLVVYPYDPAKGTADNKVIHFLLNANTKFFISKILDSGYVIRVWPFADTFHDAKSKDPNLLKNKNDFYSKLTQLQKAKAVLEKAKLHQDTLKREKEVVQINMEKTNEDKKSADSTLNIANKQFVVANDKLTYSLSTVNKNSKTRNRNNISKTSIIQLSKELNNRTEEFQQAKSEVNSKTMDFLTNISSKSNSIDTAEISKRIAELNKSKKALSLKTNNLNKIKLIGNNITVSDAKKTVLNYNNQINLAATSFVSLTNKLIKENIELNKINAKLEVAKINVDAAKSQIVKINIPPVQGSDLKANDTIFKMGKDAANTYLDDITKSESAATKYDSLAFVDSWGNYMQFYLPLKNFSDCVQIYPKNNHFTWGFLSIPLKIRVAPFSFEQNINFGLTLGWKFQPVSVVNVSHNVLMGISVGSVKLTSMGQATTMSTTNSTTSSDPPTSTQAISFSFGYMFQYDKFQAGAFIGWDIAGDHRSEFVNGNNPFIGIAIGLSLFGENKSAVTAQTQ